VILVLTAGALGSTPDYVKWEGEDAFEHNFNQNLGPHSLDHPERLSGADWLSCTGRVPPEGAYARWRVAVPEGGTYCLYARKFWQHGAFQWRFDAAKWHSLGQAALLDRAELTKFVEANWVSLGEVDLTAGEHVFEVQLLAAPGEDASAGFDCFVLTSRPWYPAGLLEPQPETGRAMEDYWAFEPGPPPDKSPINLSYLNDETAGEHGFLQRDGRHLLFQKEGEPVRFWGVTTGHMLWIDTASVDRLARRLAARGVNLVRVHTPAFKPGAADPTEVDPDYLGRLHYFVHAMKEEGIYTYLSVYFPMWFDVRPDYGLPGFEQIDNKKPFALLFFHPRMQEIYRSWARTVLTTVNPHTGLSLADDPAVAFYEIVNEDSYFFWTFDPGKTIPRECIAVLEEEFGAWAAARYGSLEKAGEAWGFPVEADDFANDRAGLMHIWQLTGEGLAQNAAAQKRAQDQARFLTEDLRDFYQEMKDWLRGELGVKCPIVTSNWKTADPTTLGSLDDYANTSGDVMDVHWYWSTTQETSVGYRISVGDMYSDISTLVVPRQMDVFGPQYEGYPQTVSDYGSLAPNRFRGESAFLAAAYGGLLGLDAVCFFALESPAWRHTLSRWPVMTPAVLGQFPAAALAYRRGDVREADAVAEQQFDLEELYRLQCPPESGETESGATGSGAEEPPKLDPLAQYAGRIVRSFGPTAGLTTHKELDRLVDTEQGVVSSVDGQTRLDYRQGVVTLNTPRAQGATGFLAGAGEVRLDDVSVASGNEYASVMVVSLDGKALADTARLLVQLMTEETNYGWQVEPDGSQLKVADLGSLPLNVRRIAGQVTVSRPDAANLRVTPLDPNGVPLQREVKTRVEPGQLVVTLEPDILYYVVEAE
jgi:hypothetical protein